MSALAFAASVVRSLAWPAAVVIIACLFFREQIREVIRKIAERIPYLRSVKAGSTEWTFDSDQLAAARIDLAKISAAGSGLRLGVTSRQDRVRQGLLDLDKTLLRTRSALVSGAARPAGETAALTSKYDLQAITIRSLATDAPPAVTVLAAWSCLEALLREIAGLTGVSDTGSLDLLAGEVITQLDRRGGLIAPDHTRSAFQRLLKLKLPVERGAAVTKLEAIDYADTALQITGLLLTAYETAYATADETAFEPFWVPAPQPPEKTGGSETPAASPGE
jgi:hypothetical protein